MLGVLDAHARATAADSWQTECRIEPRCAVPKERDVEACGASKHEAKPQITKSTPPLQLMLKRPKRAKSEALAGASK